MALAIRVVTPSAAVLDVECDQATVPGVNGELGLLPQHVPLISALQPGILTTFTGNKRQHYVVGGGFAEIDEDRVTILTGRCEPASEVDVERAKRALKDAQERLDKLGPDEPLYAKYRRRSARAQARLDGAARVS